MKAVDGAGQKGAYHISSGGDFAIKDLFDETVKALNLKLDKDVEVRPRLPDDTFTILLDPSKTNRDFNWKTTTPLSFGVKKAIEYYQSHGISQSTSVRELHAPFSFFRWRSRCRAVLSQCPTSPRPTHTPASRKLAVDTRSASRKRKSPSELQQSRESGRIES